MDIIDIKSGVTADSQDSDGDICLNIEDQWGELGSDVTLYLNKEQVEKLLSLFN